MKEVAVLNHVAGMKVGLSFVWKLNKFKYVRLLVGALAILSALPPNPASAQEQEEVRRGPVVIDEDKHDVSPLKGHTPDRSATGKPGQAAAPPEARTHSSGNRSQPGRTEQPIPAGRNDQRTEF